MAPPIPSLCSPDEPPGYIPLITTSEAGSACPPMCESTAVLESSVLPGRDCWSARDDPATFIRTLAATVVAPDPPDTV